MDDVRHQTVLGGGGATNGAETTNGKGKHANGNGAGADEDKQNLALPQGVVDDALRVTRESLEMVCEIEGDGT